ncbi:MAG: choice-of-anchor D domain-containing protein [Nannocystis sp.]|nr:choice-of-anchor D domain-containing protein [Nannocystis sp.]MBA3548195.1 choice-of-anchor D domain-containing protein [Nannocystis sp.]
MPRTKPKKKKKKKKKGSEQTVGSAVQRCPLATSTLHVDVMYWDTGRPVEGAAVTLVQTGENKQTSAGGKARFDRLKPGTYDVKLEPSGALARYSAMAAEQGDIASAGEDGYAVFWLGTPPTIDVAATLDFGKQVGGARPKLTLVIKNTGNADLVLGAIGFPALFVADAANTVAPGTTIASGASVDLKLEFHPDAVGVTNGNLTIASNDPNHATRTVALTGEQVAPTFELFRDASVLPVVPFATSDLATSLDNPLPDNKHFDKTFDRPATFDFPAKDNYAAHAVADADPSIFRLRLKDLPVGFPADDIVVTLKVTTSADEAIVGATGFRFAGTASHPAGMAVTLRKNGSVWESPYLRVATTVTDLSKSPTSAIVHSPAPTYPGVTPRIPIQGQQFGRKLKVTGTAGGQPVASTFTMGGRAYACIPVRFTWVSAAPPDATKIRRGHEKIADLNAFWAGHGLSFALHDPALPLDHKPAPDRKLIVIGEHTGSAVFADHPVQVEIDLAVTVNGTSYPRPAALLQLADPPITITADIAGNATPPVAAAAIKAAVEAWAPTGGLAGVQLGADVFDFLDPRVVVSVNGDYSPKVLDPIGARGPTDITLKRVGGPAVEKLEVTGLRVLAAGLPDATVDIFCPPVTLPFHDPRVNPASAAQRHWVRSFGPPNGDYVSVLIEPRDDVQERTVASLCEAGLSSLYNANEATKKGRIDAQLRELGSSTSPISILNFGRWSEPFARFIVFLPDGSFSPINDLQHELGHTFADCNHTIKEPAWFYSSELMHPSGPQSPNASANKMTRHKIKMDTVANNGGWQSLFQDAAEGYGGAVRARIATLAPAGWLTAGGGPGFPW